MSPIAYPANEKSPASHNLQGIILKLLFYQGSNLEFQDQNLTCYHYTIEQFL